LIQEKNKKKSSDPGKNVSGSGKNDKDFFIFINLSSRLNTAVTPKPSKPQFVFHLPFTSLYLFFCHKPKGLALESLYGRT